MTSDGSRGAGLTYKNIIKKLVPFHFKTMIHAHIHTQFFTRILAYYMCVHGYIHAGIIIIKQLLNFKGDTRLPDTTLIDGT